MLLIVDVYPTRRSYYHCERVWGGGGGGGGQMCSCKYSQVPHINTTAY